MKHCWHKWGQNTEHNWSEWEWILNTTEVNEDGILSIFEVNGTIYWTSLEQKRQSTEHQWNKSWQITAHHLSKWDRILNITEVNEERILNITKIIGIEYCTSLKWMGHNNEYHWNNWGQNTEHN